MNLNKKVLPQLSRTLVSLPGPEVFELPEKVLQFGTGVLLRGLIDYFIDHANNQGQFNGRCVVVKTTGAALNNEFEQQDNLYTHVLRGLQQGVPAEAVRINAAISRVLHATHHWQQILDCAEQPDLNIVVSNTTEVGIVLQPDEDIFATPPASFPGKLLALLYRRYQHFAGDAAKGWTIVPTELITDNGTLLKQIVLQLAEKHGLEAPFIQWLQQACYFCNSLVDRIVPGKLPAADYLQITEKLGYTDDLMIMSEWYALWAIESSDAAVVQTLSFAGCNPGVVITNDIYKYRELKLRLLNGTHTFLCGLACLAGFATVKDAMQHSNFKNLAHDLMMEEIVPCLVGEFITEEEAVAFAGQVLERFANPYIEHNG
jgi:tagaturonate reductase